MIERKQFRRSLARRGILVNLVAAIVDRDRGLHFGAYSREVFVAEQSAIGLGECRQIVSNVALVEAVARRLQRFVPPLGRDSAFSASTSFFSVRARSGFLKISPASGAWPFGR